MNDSEIYKLTDIMSRSGIDKIGFEFQDAYCDIVYCTIERRARGLLPVQSHASSSDKALKSALELMEKVKLWDKLISAPTIDKQPYQGGYHREMLNEDSEVEFKRRGIGFVITGIKLKDSNGFYCHDIPKPVSEDLTFVKDLPDGTQLYTWDNIGFLCGTAGEVIVKDGLQIKSKMTKIS